MDTTPIIEIAGLRRRFGKKAALEEVNLSIPRGQVFGLVGGNGAGKTTLLKHILGLLRAESGTVRVFGLDPVRHPVEVLGRIGFLSEDRDVPLWMRVDELMRYQRAFFPKWDDVYAAALMGQFQLDPRAKLKVLSRGELAKMGLLLALAHRPELLVLDEPSSGLDPVVRREMLEALIRAVADEGRTVVFSSHLLDEVERVSDHIGMMAGGRLVLSGSLPEIMESHSRLVVRFDPPLDQDVSPPRMPDAAWIGGSGREWSLVSHGDRPALCAALAQAGGAIVDERPASLEDVFICRSAVAPVAGAVAAEKPLTGVLS